MPKSALSNEKRVWSSATNISRAIYSEDVSREQKQLARNMKEEICAFRNALTADSGGGDADYGVGGLGDLGNWHGLDGHGEGLAFEFNRFHGLVMGVGVLHFDDDVSELGLRKDLERNSKKKPC
jgi:hypothetical protein